MKTKKQLVKALDTVIRQILKKSYPKICVTCKQPIDWFNPRENPRGLQVGHYISRTCTPLRWELRNVAPQCSPCNWKHENNPAAYTLYMLEKYGQSVIEEFNTIYKDKRAYKLSLIDLQVKLDQLTEYYNGL